MNTFGVLPVGGNVGAGEILFARLDMEKKMAEIDAFNAEKAKAAGISLVGLGTRILRTETVSSAILAAIMYENNEM